MLKTIVSSPCPFAGIDVDKYQDLLNKANEEGHVITSIEYFHGEVESKMGYDIGVCLNAEEFLNENFDKNDEDFSKYVKEGIYDVEIIDYNNPCKAYIWISTAWGKPAFRCLIVDSNNKEDNDFALDNYNKKKYEL